MMDDDVYEEGLKDIYRVIVLWPLFGASELHFLIKKC
jgi:hypothetical protein